MQPQQHQYLMRSQPHPIPDPSQRLLYELAEDISGHHRVPWAPNPWFLDVPNLISPRARKSSVIASMRAVALASRSMQRRNRSFEKSARSVYAIGLRSHIRDVSTALNSTHGPVESTELLNLLASSMLLFEFEMLLPSSPYSWMSHAKGAAKILERVGPHYCQRAPLHNTFLVLRYIMV